jgi:acyl-CoA synthetase (AMP-forming)/AMP-acid ligase II
MQLMLSALAQHAARTGSRMALRVKHGGEWSCFTYDMLAADVDSWAARFQALGLPRGGVLFIVLKHRPELYAAFLGAMRAGLAPSFLPFPTPKQNAESYWAGHKILLARVRPAGVLTYGGNVALLDEIVTPLGGMVLDIDALPDAPGSGAALPPLAEIEQPAGTALLQHSSGTTGLKKGVMLSYGQVRDQLAAYAPTIGAGAESRFISWLPLYHDMGLISSFLLPLTLGAEIISIDAFDWLTRPDMLLVLIGEHRATHCWIPNFAFNHLVRTRDRKRTYDLSSLRALMNCSEPAKPETMAQFIEVFGPHGLQPGALQVCYAMAETVFAVTQTRLGAQPRVLAVERDAFTARRQIVQARPGDATARQFLSCGAPLPGIALRLITEPGADVGEIVVSAPFLFSGYYLNPQASAEALVEGGYRTGDSGFLYEGELFVCGRLKELLIIHGRNYYAADIEEIANSVPGVKPGRTVAFSLFDPATASEVAVLRAESEMRGEAAHAALRQAVREAVFDRLELALRTVEILDPGQIIKTTSGKISRKENLEQYQASLI